MRPHRPSLPQWFLLATLVASTLLAFGACVVPDSKSGERHRWWAGLGPVLPHDTFPADCKLCHVGDGWNVLTTNFSFDHARETGVPLEGAHARASCLRCHNDRGPVSVFAAKGCVGCHQDIHQADLGPDCRRCHDEQTWEPRNQVVLHERTRFALTGAHATVACHKCHPGAYVGNFLPTDTECVSCHRRDLLGTNNPNHVALGFVDHCEKCHGPTDWHTGVFK
jgi:hypothetical protein